MKKEINNMTTKELEKLNINELEALKQNWLSKYRGNLMVYFDFLSNNENETILPSLLHQNQRYTLKKEMNPFLQYSLFKKDKELCRLYDIEVIKTWEFIVEGDWIRDIEQIYNKALKDFELKERSDLVNQLSID